MGTPGFLNHTHSLQRSYLCYQYLNDISSTKQLSTVEITKYGNKITTKVEKLFFTRFTAEKILFLIRSRNKDFPDIYLMRSYWHSYVTPTLWVFFTAVRVGVTPITKGPPLNFFGWHFFFTQVTVF